MKETCLLVIDRGIDFFGSDSEVSMESKETTLGKEMFATNQYHRTGLVLHRTLC
jgi:hypothetical protein